MKIFYLYISIFLFCGKLFSQSSPTLEISSNPFQGTTTLSYTLSQNDYVSIFVTDVSGKIVLTLLSDKITFFGYHNQKIDLENFAAGIYFLTFKTTQITLISKMINLGASEPLVSLQEESKFSNFKIYPNPCSNNLNLDFNTFHFQKCNYSIINNLGEIVSIGELMKDFNTIDLSFLCQGIYSLKIKTETIFVTYKLIKN